MAMKKTTTKKAAPRKSTSTVVKAVSQSRNEKMGN